MSLTTLTIRTFRGCHTSRSDRCDMQSAIFDKKRKLNSQSSPHSINHYFTHEEKCSRFIVIHTEHALTDTSSRVKRKRRGDCDHPSATSCAPVCGSQQLRSEERGDRDPGRGGGERGVGAVGCWLIVVYSAIQLTSTGQRARKIPHALAGIAASLHLVPRIIVACRLAGRKRALCGAGAAPAKIEKMRSARSEGKGRVDLHPRRLFSNECGLPNRVVARNWAAGR